MLDSNIVIPYLADDPATVPLVERLAPQGITISVLTYLEAYPGTLRSPDPHTAQAEFARFLAAVPVLPLSLTVARRCARLREELGRQRKRVRTRVFDLVIAATALEHGLQLVTRNLDDFADIPARSLYQPSWAQVSNPRGASFVRRRAGTRSPPVFVLSYRFTEGMTR